MGFKARIGNEIIDIPDNASITQHYGDMDRVWDVCGCMGLCPDCRELHGHPVTGCGKQYEWGIIKSEKEKPFVQLSGGDGFYVDEVIWMEGPSMETDEVKVVHWWPGREFNGDNPIPQHHLHEAKRMGSRYLTVASQGNMSAAAFCCRKDIPSRRKGRWLALNRLRLLQELELAA